MHPTFAQFVEALRTPALRPSIRLVISDEDATRLLSDDTWMRDYYAQWIALFPTATTSAAEQSRGPRVGPALIVGGLIAVCVAIAVVALVVPHPSSGIAVAGDNHSASARSTPTPTASNPAGLTTAEVDLLNAELDVSGSSIDKLVAGGMTDTQLQQLATVETGIADLACTEVTKLPDGFQTAGAKDKFTGEFEKGFTILGRTVTPTPAQAERVWTSIEGYCKSKNDPSPRATP